MRNRSSIVKFDPPQRRPMETERGNNRETVVDWDTPVMIYGKLCALLWAGKLAEGEDNLIDDRKWSEHMVRAGLLEAIIRHIIPGLYGEWLRKGGNPETFGKNLLNRVYFMLRERGEDGKLKPGRSGEHPSNPKSALHAHWEKAQHLFLKAKPIQNKTIEMAFRDAMKGR